MSRCGGAVLTAFGHDLIARYRAIERAASKKSAAELAVLDAARGPARPLRQAAAPRRSARDGAHR